MLKRRQGGARVAHVRIPHDSPDVAYALVMFTSTHGGTSTGAGELTLDQLDDGVLSEVIQLCTHLLHDCRRRLVRRPNGTGTDEGGADREAANLSASVRNAVRCMKENFADPDLTLDAVAEAVYLSRWHLSRTFRQQTGRRFVEYLTNLRLERSAALLANTDRSVTEIARQVGYREPGHFQRTFKRWAGVSPSQYRGRRGPVAADDRMSA